MKMKLRLHVIFCTVMYIRLKFISYCRLPANERVSRDKVSRYISIVSLVNEKKIVETSSCIRVYLN